MYVNNGHKTHGQDIMYLKWREKKDTNNPHYIPQKEHSPYEKTPMLTLLLSMTTLITKTTPPFCHE